MSTQIIQYKGLPVLVTTQLADFYKTSQKNLHDNFRNNLDRFIEGKHYYKLVGEELIEFKNYPDFIGVVAKNSKHLILWTERGAARHAKMLDTDHAWDVFEQLEDCYFNQVSQNQSESRPMAPSGAEMYLPKTQGKYFIENKKDGTLIVRDANKVTTIRKSSLEVVRRDCQTIRQELELFIKQLDQLEKSLVLDDELLPILARLNWRGTA